MDTLSLFLVPLLAVVAPILAAIVGRVALVPLVVFEIVLGIVVGPSLLGWVHSTDVLTFLSQIGLAMLFFVAGSEIDFAAIKGHPIRFAGLAWLIAIVVGVGLGILVAPNVDTGVVIGIAVASTALGTILPTLRDAGELGTPFGRSITAIGAMGEFGPLLAISLFLSGRDLGVSLVVVIIFAVAAVGSILLAARGRGFQRPQRFITATLHSSGQFAIRLILAILAALVALSIVLGLDMLLGAFVAGVLWRIFASGATPQARESVESKIEAISFGFLVPIFFITTGVNFNLHSIIDAPRHLIYVPIFLVALLALRGLPSLLVVPKGSSWADRRATVLFGSTSLPIIIAVTTIGVERHLIDSAFATALVTAGMLSVIIFPLLGMSQRRRQLAREAQQELMAEDDS
jgi:Kef-type K+ transport system membrane component KefB